MLLDDAVLINLEIILTSRILFSRSGLSICAMKAQFLMVTVTVLYSILDSCSAYIERLDLKH